MNKKLLCAALLAGLGVAQAASAQEFDDRWYLTGSAGVNVQDGDRKLAEQILKLMAQDRVDYTIFWRRLSHFAGGAGADTVSDLFVNRAAAGAWLDVYAKCQPDSTLMLRTNPKYVLRNHLGELAIRDAKLKDFSTVDTLMGLLQAPFDEHPAHEDMAGFPPDWASQIEISCSS